MFVKICFSFLWVLCLYWKSFEDLLWVSLPGVHTKMPGDFLLRNLKSGDHWQSVFYVEGILFHPQTNKNNVILYTNVAVFVLKPKTMVFDIYSVLKPFSFFSVFGILNLAKIYICLDEISFPFCFFMCVMMYVLVNECMGVHSYINDRKHWTFYAVIYWSI